MAELSSLSLSVGMCVGIGRHGWLGASSSPHLPILCGTIKMKKKDDTTFMLSFCRPVMNLCCRSEPVSKGVPLLPEHSHNN